MEEKDVKKLKRVWAKERKSLKAEIRRIRRLQKAQEKEVLVADRICAIVRDSVGEIPPIAVPTLPVIEHLHDEVALLVLSDCHIGKKTKSYNPRVFAKRLRSLEASMLSIVSSLRSIRPIRKLVLVFNGDLVDSTSIYPGQAMDGVSMPTIDQIFTVGVPELTGFLLFCLANFEEVEVYCQRGNHGRLYQAKWVVSKGTNWDVVLYKALEVATRGQDRLTWHINPLEWKSMFKILGHGFLATHGDMIRQYYNLPFYGLVRQSTRWQSAYRKRIKLDYFLFSHFHSACAGLRFNQVEVFVNGSFITDDTFGEEQIGVSSTPEQVFLGIHEKTGVSWRYVLDLTK